MVMVSREKRVTATVQRLHTGDYISDADGVFEVTAEPINGPVSVEVQLRKVPGTRSKSYTFARSTVVDIVRGKATKTGKVA